MFVYNTYVHALCPCVCMLLVCVCGVCTYVHMCACTCVYVCAYVCVCTCVYIHIMFVCISRTRYHIKCHSGYHLIHKQVASLMYILYLYICIFAVKVIQGCRAGLEPRIFHNSCSASSLTATEPCTPAPPTRLTR